MLCCDNKVAADIANTIIFIMIEPYEDRPFHQRKARWGNICLPYVYLI